MNIDQAFPTKYISSQDLRGQEVQVTIANVIMEDIDGKGETKPVVYFHGKQKGLVLNKTNAHTISEMYGPETDVWRGQAIMLFTIMTEFQGKPVEGLRVKRAVPHGQAVGAQAPITPPLQPQPNTGGGAPGAILDDDIPF